jgi:hypothetical protein
MRQICISRDGLTRAAPNHAEATRLLLALLSAADDLNQLATLNSIAVSPSGTDVVLCLGGVELEGKLVQASQRERNGSIAQLGVSTGLLISEIRVDGRPLLQATG